ncbi:MAG: 2'-5' RNA ligase family protein [Candidatus Aenigmarchaeota archaeon]|nr:2'-5' RNA ligase family protein [Candidatus Aenigmarchaeota archaeon]
MTIPVLVGLAPPPALTDIINSVRNAADKITPINYYRQAEPHITLFVNTFPSVERVEDIVSDIAKRTPAFDACVAGLHSFGYDAATRLHTLVYRLEDSPELRKMQQEVVKQLNAIRTPEQALKHMHRQDITDEQRKNLEAYGLLYSAETWTFHATIGSFPEEYIDEVSKLAVEFSQSWKVTDICVYTKENNAFRVNKKHGLK